MLPPFLHSAGRRFLKRLGFSLAQAAIVGSVIGLLVASRPARTQLVTEDGPRSILSTLALWMEGMERPFYDARARFLGSHSQPSDRVVVVAIDDESLAETRQSEHSGIASYPWPREILGGMVKRMLDEGAPVVMTDLPFTERSPRTCGTAGLTPLAGLEDDESFQALLDAKPGRALLSFSFGTQRPLPPSSRLWSHRLRVGRFTAPAAQHQALQSVLAQQRPAFLIPQGTVAEVWAGVASEQEGRRLAELLDVKGSPRVEERSAEDEGFRVSATELLVSLAEVKVEGLSPQELLEVRHLEVPVAPLLGTAHGYGSVTLLPDGDGVLRAVPHLVRYVPRSGETHLLPSLPLAAAMRLAKTDTLRYAQGRLHVGNQYAFPMEPNGFSWVRWDAEEGGRGARGSVARSLSAWSVLTNLLDVIAKVPPRLDQDLDGRTVMLTDASAASQSFVATPLGARTPSGAVWAQGLVNILQSEGIRRMPPNWDWMATYALAFFGAFVALTFSSRFRSTTGAVFYFMSLVASAAAYLVLLWYVFLHQRLWVAAFGPLFALVTTFLLTSLYALRTEQDVRSFVSQALGRYVSPEVLRRVTHDLSLMHPERRQLTVCFADIEGFTKLAQELPPEQTVALLNSYFTEMTAAVRDHHGQVDKYVGDAVLSFWGAPVRTEQHAQWGCESALRMRQAFLAHQDTWEKKYGQRIQFRAGLDSGPGVVGDMGSELKSNYTVIGEVVNLATSLEKANRNYGTYLLVGEETVRQVGNAFVFREVDKLVIKGRLGFSRIYELWGRKGEVSKETLASLERFQDALALFRAKRFTEAMRRFEGEAGQDPVARFYVSRCRFFLEHPPAEGWEGDSKVIS